MAIKLKLREDRPATIDEHRELRTEIEWLRAGYREILHTQRQTECVPQWIVEMSTEKLRLPSYYSEPFTGEQAARPIKCEGCDTGIADPPSRLCPGCQAYIDHQR